MPEIEFFRNMLALLGCCSILFGAAVFVGLQATAPKKPTPRAEVVRESSNIIVRPTLQHQSYFERQRWFSDGSWRSERWEPVIADDGKADLKLIATTYAPPKLKE